MYIDPSHKYKLFRWNSLFSFNNIQIQSNRLVQGYKDTARDTRLILGYKDTGVQGYKDTVIQEYWDTA